MFQFIRSLQLVLSFSHLHFNDHTEVHIKTILTAESLNTFLYENYGNKNSLFIYGNLSEVQSCNPYPAYTFFFFFKENWKVINFRFDFFFVYFQLHCINKFYAGFQDFRYSIINYLPLFKMFYNSPYSNFHTVSN